MLTLKNTLPLFSPRCKVPRKSDLLNLSNSKFRQVALSAVLALATVAALPISGQELALRSGAENAEQSSDANKALITVRSAASVHIPGPLFSVQVTSLKPVDSNIPELIQRVLQEGLIKNDPRLQAATSMPDTLIACTLTDLAVGSEVAGRTRSEYRKTGERIVHDSTTGMSRTEDEYGYVDVPYRVLVLEGRMTVECEVKDSRTGILLYAGRFDPVYNEVLREVIGGSSPPSIDNLSSVYLKLAQNAAVLILAQFSPRTYSEIVQLPKGKLKEAGKLLETDRWKEALDLLDGMAPKKDPNDEAYRLYTLGVAHEALAYEEVDPVETKRHLEEAVANYLRATQLKPREDMFWKPKNRAELSLWYAGAPVAQIEVFEEAKKSASRSAGTGPDQPAAPRPRALYSQVISKSQPLPIEVNNETVVRWVKSGLGQDYITASVRHAPKFQFDVSPAEVLKLRREGVSGRIIKAMRDMQHPRYRYTQGFTRRTLIMVLAISLLSIVPVAIYH